MFCDVLRYENVKGESIELNITTPYAKEVVYNLKYTLTSSFGTILKEGIQNLQSKQECIDYGISILNSKN